MNGAGARKKGHDFERFIARELNECVDSVRAEWGLEPAEVPQVQRNQNQSAVGGDDFAGTLHFAIEAKRQEQLSIASWWKQAQVSAAREGREPVLVFKQNRKPIQVMLRLCTIDGLLMRVVIEWEDFKTVFVQALRAHYVDVTC